MIKAAFGILRNVDVFVGMEVMIPTAQVGNKLLISTGLGNGSRGEVVGFANADGVPVCPNQGGWSTEDARLPNGEATRVTKPPPGEVQFLLRDSKVPFQ